MVLQRILIKTRMFTVRAPSENSAREGICLSRQVPPQERGCLHIGAKKTFLITSILPILEKDKAKVLTRLSRTSKTLSEILLREKTGELSIRCRRRIAGVFSEIETSQRIPKEVIQSVSNELGERIIVRVVASHKRRLKSSRASDPVSTWTLREK